MFNVNSFCHRHSFFACCFFPIVEYFVLKKQKRNKLPITIKYLAGHAECGQGPNDCNWPRKVALLGGKAQLAECLREQEDCPLEETLASSDDAQSVIKNAVNEASMHAATPSWRTVLSSRVDKAVVRNVLAPALLLNPQVPSAASRARIVFCAMPQHDGDA